MTHDLALGEIQSLCTKAARGAGRAIGVAEDAGRAVRWLSARGLNGAGALTGLLQVTDGKAASDLAPALPQLSPMKLAICPLTLGGYVSDRGVLPQGAIGPVWAPILLQPFVDDLSETGVLIVVDHPLGDPVTVRLVPRRDRVLGNPCTRAQISSETMKILLDFAARTYAPATEQSRAQGAGAGLTDND